MNPLIEKQRNLADLALSSLLRRRTKNIVLLAVYTAVVFALGSALFFSAAMKREAALLLRDAPLLTVQKLTAGRHDLISRSAIEKIRHIEGIADVMGRLWGYYFEPVSGANFTIMVPHQDTPEPGTIVIGRGVARVTKAAAGDMYPFDSAGGGKRMLTVERVIDDAADLLTSDLVLMAEADFRDIAGVPDGLFTDLSVDIPNPKEVNTVARKILLMLPGTRPVAREEILRTYDAVFDWRGGILLVILSGSVLAFVILAWDRATLSGEEKREIGLLKAVGWDTADVLLMKFWEGAVISLAAFCGGVLLAYVHVFVAGAVLITPVIKGWSVLYPEFHLTPLLDPSQLVALFCLTVVPYVTSSVIPAWRAASTDPDSVMR